MLPIEKFSKTKLINLISDNQIEQAKAYTKQYFYKCSKPLSATYYYDSFLKSFTLYKQDEVTKSELTNNIKRCDYDNRGRKINSFSIPEWFYKEDDTRYYIDCDPLRDSLFVQKGQNFINLFPRFPHERIPYKTYSDDVKEKVEFIINHIRRVICSDKEDQLKYVMCWFARVCSGYKNNSILYWTDAEGTGKSSVIDFFKTYVLGNNLVYTDDNPGALTHWNEMLQGKVLVAFEEISAQNNGHYHCITKAIKHISTSKTIMKRQRYKDTIEIKNTSNVIIISNERPLKTYRSIMACDLCSEKAGNYQYFDTFHKYMKGERVGEAFYNFLREWDEKYGKDFEDFKIPRTNTGDDMIIEHLISSYQFLKDHFLHEGKGIEKVNLRSLYQDYVWYMEGKKKKPVQITTFRKDLRAVGIKLGNPENTTKIVGEKKVKTTVRRFNYSYDDIYMLYDKKRFIHETDELPRPDGYPKKVPKKKERFIASGPSLEIERLLALVEKLKAKNKKLKKKLKTKNKNHKKKAIILSESEVSTTEYEDSTTGYDSTTEYENSTTEYEDTTDESDESCDTESEQLLFDECVDLISTLDKNPKKIIEV